MYRHLLPALLLILNACALHRPADPAIGLNAALSAGEIRADDGNTLYTDWWHGYGDDTLNRLIARALERNTDLKQAALNVYRARSQETLQQRQLLLPALNGGIDISENRNLDDGSRNRSRRTQIGLRYELDLWQRLNTSAAAQSWTVQAAAEDLAAARAALVRQTADTYFQIALLDRLLQHEQHILDRKHELHRIAESRLRHGKTDAAETDRTQTALIEAENRLTALRQNRDDALTLLRNLLNLRPDDALPVAGQQFRLPAGSDADLSVPLDILAGRPDILAAEARLQAAAGNRAAQKLAWLPRITVAGALSSQNTRGGLFELPLLGSSISLSLPFLDWPTLQWQNRQAQADFEQAQLKFAQTLTTALNEVRSSALHHRNSRAALAKLEAAYKLAQNGSRYHTARHRHGLVPPAEMLNALNNEDTAAQALLRGRYQALLDENALYQALGGRHRNRPHQPPYPPDNP